MSGMLGAQPGDASHAIYARFRDELRGWLLRRVADEAAADDLVADVFVRLHQRLSDGEALERPRAWLYQVLRRRLVDYYRSASRAPEVRDPTTLPEQLDEAVDSDLYAELSGCVRPLLEGLDPAQADALRRTALEGRTIASVAADEGISVSGMKSRVQRGRRGLRAALERCCRLEMDHRDRPMAARPRSDCC